ncbi:PKD domain-containing protein [Paenibacillaceae bacterium WGS1546]|uniref:PKD domain-containing protein n=1 Tax=Cohnella sp. WGS1546 TaxID=3366810 RepID=UPI00372D1A89
MKKFFSSILALSTLLSLVPLYPSFKENVAEAAVVSSNTIDRPSVSPAGPSSSQTMTTPVEASARTTPGVFWSQMDDGKFRASEYIDTELEQIAITERGGGRQDGGMYKEYPAAGSRFRTIIDTNKYKPGTWQDVNGKVYAVSNVQNTKLNKSKLMWVDQGRNATYQPAPPTESSPDIWPGNDMWVVHYTYTGGPTWTTNERYGNPEKYKFTVSYATPMDLHWLGEVKQTKTMRLQSTSLNVNQSKNMVAEVQTTGYGAANWTNVSSSAERWTSSNTSVATIDSRGKITGLKAGTTQVTAEWRQGLYHLRATATVTVTQDVVPPEPTPTPEPQPYVITGNFDILPSQTIEWRDTFTFRPKDFVIPSQCTYNYHRYLIEREGYWSRSDNVNGRSINTTYTYANYPFAIGIGTHDVSLKIFATCEGKAVETDWIATKDLNINGPTQNRPPVFTAGWFPEPDRYSFDPPHEIVVGTRVNLRIINDIRSDPPMPYDPDGDPIMYTWDFAGSDSSWVRRILDDFGNYIHEELYGDIIADELGRHCVRVTARDPYGASSTRNVCVSIVPENPIPIINAPPEVVEGRPLAFPIDGNRSYSPMKRSIVRYDWTNKHDRYMVPGTERITLEVTDSIGLRSEAPAVHNLIVKEDLPPIPKLDYVDMALRTTPVVIVNSSYSPDNDEIVENIVTYRYDSNNDGSFDDEVSVPVTFDEYNQFVFNPPQVGKYRFTVYVKEDWGKDATKDFDLTVVNDNPQAAFSVSGEVEQPPGALPEAILPTQLLSNTWKTTNLNGDIAKRFYRNDNELISGITHSNITPTFISPNEYVSKEARYIAPDPGAPIRDIDFDELLRAAFGDEYSLTTRDNGANVPWGSRYTHQLRKNGEIVAEINSLASAEQVRQLGSSAFITNGRLSIYNYSGYLCGWNSSDGTSGDYGGTYYNFFSLSGSTGNVGVSNYKVCDGEPKYSRLVYAKGDPEFKVTTTGSGNTAVYRIVRMIGPSTEAYAVNLPRESVQYRVGYTTRTELPTVFPVSSDGSRMAHLEFREEDTNKNTYLRIRSNFNGGLISEHLVHSDSNSNPSTVKILHYASNRIVVGYGAEVHVYDFSGNRVWGGTASTLGIDNMQRFADAGIASKDGKLLFIDMTGTDSRFTLYFKSLNLITGAIERSVELGNYNVASYYYKGPIVSPPYFMDDGKVLLTYGAWTDSYDCWGCGNHRVTNKVVDGLNPVPEYSTNLGQFYSTSKEIVNAEYQYALKLPKTFYRERENAGFSFRMKDNKNMYRVETTNYKVRVVKIVDGQRNILAEMNRVTPADVWVNYKVRAVGTRIKVYINNVPLLEATDDSPSFGYYGPYADREYVSFKDISVLPYEIDMMDNVSLVDQPVEYETTWNDPEDDPQLKERTTWHFEHSNPNKFLNAGDGKSGLSSVHNRTVDSPVLSFDRVGTYKITYRSSDDPHPDYRYPSNVFNEYREYSDDYWQDIVVHRRPIARFTLSIDPATKKVVWNDMSYDPDRWLSPTQYSTEPTGIDYRTTRGVINRMYYYIDPSGQVSNTQLVAPRTPGTYKVGLSVKDEYNAWSEWYEQSIEITQPIIDEPPIPGFTLSKTTLHASETLTIASTAYDKEDGPAANLPHRYYIRNVTTGSAETLQSTERGTWTKAFNSIGDFEIRQVVTDSIGQSAQLIRTFSVVNRPPVADFDWSPKPAYEGDSIALTNRSSDPDGDPLTYSWTVEGPQGFRKTGTAQHMTLTGAETENRPGSYVVTLRAADPYGAAHSVSKTIVVAELALTGLVSHTPEWDRNRQNWNAKYPAKFREENVFWAGEAFVLTAIATDTGTSGTKAVSVVAEATAELRKPLAMDTPDAVRWTGLLRQADTNIQFVELPEGFYTFVFTVLYSNGVRKTSSFPIEIRGTVDQYVQVHRLR